jgi:glycosyltransferase involved in cell wall biosynthesis
MERSTPAEAADDPVEFSLIIPFYNEREAAAGVVQEALAALPGAGVGTFEIICVDDASTDDTGEILAAQGAGDARVVLVRQPQNLGQSAALLAGWARARGAVVGTMDGDGQCDPEDLGRLYALLVQSGVDLVGGVRVERQDPLAKRLMSRAGNLLRRLALDNAWRDGGCPIKVMRRPVLGAVLAFRATHRYLLDLAALEGFEVAEMAVSHRARREGISKYGFKNRFLPTACDLLMLHLLSRRHLRRRNSGGGAPGSGPDARG